MKQTPNNVAKPLVEALLTQPDRPFLGCMTSGNFLSRVAGRQEILQEAGVSAGDHVITASQRREDFWVDLIAMWGFGCVIVPVDPNTPADKLSVIADKASPTAIAWTDGPVPEQFRKLVKVPDEQRISDAPVVVAKTETDDLCSILFTSGSTGTPKGVALSHRSISGNCLSTLEALDIASDDRLLISIPFHFTSAICHFLAAGYAGITLISIEKKLFKADLFNALKDNKATCFGGAPIQLCWISECAAEAQLSLNWVMSSGDHLSVSVIKKIQKYLPSTKIYTFYGLTELGGRFCCLKPELINCAVGSVGKAINGLSVTIRDEKGREVSQGEVGEVYAEGGYLFDGYIGAPKITQACLGPRGLATGDLGYLDEMGLLWLSGRTDDIFKSSGQKVSLVPITDALMKTGQFEDVAVVACEHPIAGHVPYVFYVSRQASEPDRYEVMKQLRKILPANHLPQGFSEIKAIPRTGSGKVRRQDLKALL